jgi:hypothetical protein
MRQVLIAVPDFFDQLVRKVGAYGARLKSACGQLGKWIAEVRRPGFCALTHPPTPIVALEQNCPLL